MAAAHPRPRGGRRARRPADLPRARRAHRPARRRAWPALGLGPGDPVLFQVTNRLGASWPGTACSRPGWCRSARSPRTAATRSARSAAASAPSRTWSRRGRAASTWSASPREQQRDHPTLRPLVLGAVDELAIESLGADARPAAPRARPSRRSRPGIDPDDVAVFQLSGGTTGVPKVIPRLHAEYWYNAAAYAALVGLDARHPRRAPDPDHPQRRASSARCTPRTASARAWCSAPPTSTPRCR